MKKKIKIVLIIIMCTLLIEVIYISIPKFINPDYGTILIAEPKSSSDIALYGSGSGIFFKRYVGKKPKYVIIYNNGIVLQKSYSSENYVFLPDLLEKTQDIKYVTKITKSDVKELKLQLIDEYQNPNKTNEKGNKGVSFDFEQFIKYLFEYEVNIKNDNEKQNFMLNAEKTEKILEKFNIEVFN